MTAAFVLVLFGEMHGIFYVCLCGTSRNYAEIETYLRIFEIQCEINSQLQMTLLEYIVGLFQNAALSHEHVSIRRHDATNRSIALIGVIRVHLVLVMRFRVMFDL